ncbi:MAG TPA: hypothetical protein VIG99_03280, partial [Myxococcaceae bacterium]
MAGGVAATGGGGQENEGNCEGQPCRHRDLQGSGAQCTWLAARSAGPTFGRRREVAMNGKNALSAAALVLALLAGGC